MATTVMLASNRIVHDGNTTIRKTWQVPVKSLILVMTVLVGGTTWLVVGDDDPVTITTTNNEENGAVCEGFDACTPWRKNHQHHQPPSRSTDPVCGVWLAPSTIPGAGLGVFAGKDYVTGDAIGPSGDIVIPIVDLRIHQPDHPVDNEWFFLWDEYVWHGGRLQMSHEGWQEVSGASPGTVVAMNSFIDLLNVGDWQPTLTTLLDRRYDPGAGAITYYQNRWATATRNINAGEECFISYGDEWFHVRANLGPIPLKGDLDRAATLFRRYQKLMSIYNAPSSVPSKHNTSALWKDLWVTFITKNAWINTSRTLGSFNASNVDTEWIDLQQKHNGSLFQLRRTLATRDLQWIQEHGVCADHLRVSPSTLPQAGRGAFTVRFLPKGSVVALLPMIHIPFDHRFDMYAVTTNANGKAVLEKPKRMVGKQLFLNYCYGHNESTMLLSPYGSNVNSVNHNQTLANVFLRWADPAKSNLNASLLEQSVQYIADTQRKAVLAMELVATRDIQEGEEIFLDYGDEWEAAWQHHIQSWQSPPDSNGTEVKHWNADMTTRLRTVFEQIHNPYPPNLELKCDQSFRMENEIYWRHLINEPNSPETLEIYRHWFTDILAPCDVLRWRHDGNRILYTVMIYPLASFGAPLREVDNFELMVDVPREAFVFVDRPYTSDMFLPKAFRHAIMIPDEIFPKAWKNRKESS